MTQRHSKPADSATPPVSRIRLADFSLFADLTDDRAALSALAARCSHHSLKRGRIVVDYLDEDKDVWFILEGAARAVIYSGSGKEVSFRDITAGGFFGEFAPIDGGRRSACVIALSKLEALRMPADVFRGAIADHPAVRDALLRHLVRLLRDYTSRIMEFGTLPVAGRVHAELIRLARTSPEDASDNTAVIDHLPTHADIATRLGTHREAVTKELSRLSKEGILELNRRRARILDLEALSALVLDGEVA